MAEGRSLRRIADPVVAAAPAGVRIRTRIRPTAEEADALRAVGDCAGSGCTAASWPSGLVWGDWIPRPTQRGVRSASRHVTAASSSRWAGAITRTVEDQYQLGMRGLATHVADLRAAVAGA